MVHGARKQPRCGVCGHKLVKNGQTSAGNQVAVPSVRGVKRYQPPRCRHASPGIAFRAMASGRNVCQTAGNADNLVCQEDLLVLAHHCAPAAAGGPVLSPDHHQRDLSCPPLVFTDRNKRVTRHWLAMMRPRIRSRMAGAAFQVPSPYRGHHRRRARSTQSDPAMLA